MRRILYLIKGLGRGGAEQSILNGAGYHDTSRFSYELAYLTPGHDDLAPEFEALGVQVHCLGSRGVSWVGRLRSLVRDRRIDLVHIHSPYAAVGGRMGLKGLARIVYSEQNVWNAYHPATRWANMLTFPLNDHVIAISDCVRRSIEYPKTLPFRMPPVSVVHHGLDWNAVATWRQFDGARAALGLPQGVPVVGTVANFKPAKGHRYLIDAARIVRRTVPDVRFVLLGRGPLEQKLRQQVADLGLKDTVLFPRYRGPAPSVVSAFDIFAFPSLREGLGIAALEAMALGRPMVVSDIGPLVELMGDPPCGVVVPTAQPEALAQAIADLIDDPQLRSRLGEAARGRATAFDVRTVVERTESLYEELISG